MSILQYTFNILCVVFVSLLGIIEASDEFEPLRSLHVYSQKYDYFSLGFSFPTYVPLNSKFLI